MFRSRWWWPCNSPNVQHRVSLRASPKNWYIRLGRGTDRAHLLVPLLSTACLRLVCIHVLSSPFALQSGAKRGLQPSVCFFGGPIVNKLGIKWALVLGAMSFPIQGSSYYCNSKFGNQWVSGGLFRLSNSIVGDDKV